MKDFELISRYPVEWSGEKHMSFATFEEAVEYCSKQPPQITIEDALERARVLLVEAALRLDPVFHSEMRDRISRFLDCVPETVRQ